MDKVIKPKTAKGKRALRKKEAQVNEGPKNAIFLRGSSANLITTSLMRDISMLKKPNSVFFNRRKDMKPFEDASGIEFFAKKTQSSLFMFASHSKKRPNNLAIGRTFDYNIMDMFELGVEDYKAMKEFQKSKISWGSKPLLLFAGTQFDEEEEYKRLKNLLIDFFVGQTMDGIRLGGLEYCIQILAFESKLYFRTYKLILKSTGTRYAKLELEELGPRFTCSLRRSKLATEDLMKKALKRPSESKVKKIKNTKKDTLGTTFGRIHMTRQDYSKLQTRKIRGLKGKRSKSQARNSSNEPSLNGDANSPLKRPADISSKKAKKARFLNPLEDVSME